MEDLLPQGFGARIETCIAAARTAEARERLRRVAMANVIAAIADNSPMVSIPLGRGRRTVCAYCGQGPEPHRANCLYRVARIALGLGEGGAHG